MKRIILTAVLVTVTVVSAYDWDAGMITFYK